MSIELIPNRPTVSRWCTRPTFIHVCGSVCLRKTIIALGCGGFNDYAKHFEVDHDGNDFAAAARFHQLLVDGLIAPTFKQGIIIVSRHLVCIYIIYNHKRTIMAAQSITQIQQLQYEISATRDLIRDEIMDKDADEPFFK